jgi:hypothetical protein
MTITVSHERQKPKRKKKKKRKRNVLYEYFDKCYQLLIINYQHVDFWQVEAPNEFTWMHLHQTWLDGLEGKDDTSWFI